MDMLYRYNEAIAALENYLEQNKISKDAAYDPDCLIHDMCSGYLENLLRLAVKPQYVVFDDYLCEVLANYMVEV